MVNYLKSKIKFFGGGEFMMNTLFLFGGSMVANVLNYVFHLVIGRQVSVSVYGEAESLISLVAIVSVPAATLSMVAVKYAAACKAEGNRNGSWEIWKYLNRKVLKYGLPILLLMVLLTPFVGNFLNIEKKWSLLLIWITMYISFFNSVNNGLLNGWQKFKKVSFANAFSAFIKLVFGIALVYGGFALGGIVGSLALAGAASYVVTLIFLRINILKKTETIDSHCESKVDFVSLKRYIIPAFVGNLAINILGYADMVFAKHVLSPTEAGQYGALTVVSKVIFFGTGVIASVLFSMSSEKNHKGDSSRQILKTALILVLVASGFATAIYFTYPALILSLLFGDKYANAAPFLGWFAVAVSLFSLANVIFQYLLSIHKTRIAFVMLTISILMVLLIVVFGSNIQDIIAIVIGAQALCAVAGIFYLYDLRIYPQVKMGPYALSIFFKRRRKYPFLISGKRVSPDFLKKNKSKTR